MQAGIANALYDFVDLVINKQSGVSMAGKKEKTVVGVIGLGIMGSAIDRKSTRLNSSH